MKGSYGLAALTVIFSTLSINSIGSASVLAQHHHSFTASRHSRRNSTSVASLKVTNGNALAIESRRAVLKHGSRIQSARFLRDMTREEFEHEMARLRSDGVNTTNYVYGDYARSVTEADVAKFDLHSEVSAYLDRSKTNGTTRGIIGKPVDIPRARRGQEKCLPMAYLQESEIQYLASSAFETPDYILVPPLCSGTEFHSLDFGNACQYRQTDMFEQFYDMGMYFFGCGSKTG